MCCVYLTHAGEDFQLDLGDFELDLRRHAGEIGGVTESVGDAHLLQDLAQGRLGRDGELGQVQFHRAARETPTEKYEWRNYSCYQVLDSSIHVLNALKLKISINQILLESQREKLFLLYLGNTWRNTEFVSPR